MVKFALIKEVELKNPNKCDGCAFQDTGTSGAREGANYCKATAAEWLINTTYRPKWCPLVLNYKEALRIAHKLLEGCLGPTVGERAYKDIDAFNDLCAREIDKNPEKESRGE